MSTASRLLPGEFEIVDDLWFEDATYIFQAGSKLFRLYRGILAKRSSVFHDMFSVPQPVGPVTPDVMDGCTLIRLPDDANDVYPFFRAIFDHEYFQASSSDRSVDFSHTVSILRLSHKYDVPYLRKRALTCLSNRFPRTVYAWDQNLRWPRYEKPLSTTDLLDMLSVIFEVDELAMAPAVLYRICMGESVADLLDTPQWEGCDSSIRRRCMIGHSRQREASVDLCRIILRPHPKCLKPSICTTERLNWVSDTKLCCSDPLGSHGSVYPWTVNNDFKGRLCSECQPAIERSFTKAREELWEKLPSIYDLSAWVDLVPGWDPNMDGPVIQSISSTSRYI